MKNKVIVTVCALLAMATASAQNAYDAEKLLGNDLNGTARFVGMGGDICHGFQSCGDRYFS